MKFTLRKREGKLYKVKLAPKEHEYLLWDKTFDEQSDFVKDAILTKIDGFDDDDTGKDIYELAALFTESSSPREASELLRSAGIRGIKYLDGSSRGKGEGNYNYVVFDDADVEITARFSLQSNPPADGGIRAARLQRVVDKLNKLFPDLKIIVHDSPTDVAWARPDAKGAYYKRQVHLFRSNIADAVDAARTVVAHEVTHHGLEALGERGRRLLERVVKAHPKEVADILDSNGWQDTEENRIRAANELVAEHGETRLKPTIWQQIRQLIKETIARLTGRMVNKPILDEAIAEIQQLAKQGRREQADLQQAEPSYALQPDTLARYEQRIDELFKPGAKPNIRKGVTILDRSDVLGMLGLGEKPVLLVENKVIAGIKNHGLKPEDWKKIPAWLEDPAMVFDSATQAGRLVFVPKELVNNNPVLMIVDPGADANKIHLLINAYDKDRGQGVLKGWVSDGKLRYFAKTRSAVLDRSGLQLPSLSQAQRFDGQKVYRDKDLVKYKNDHPYYSLKKIGAAKDKLVSLKDKFTMDNLKYSAATFKEAMEQVPWDMLAPTNLEDLVRTINPLDGSRGYQLTQELLPEQVKAAIGKVFVIPSFLVERHPKLRPFVETGSNREAERYQVRLDMAGHKPGQLDDRSFIKRTIDSAIRPGKFTDGTQWGDFVAEYKKLTQKQKEAVAALFHEGDIRGVAYTKIETAKLNKKLTALVDEESFELYKKVRDFVDNDMMEARLKWQGVLMRSIPDITEGEVARHISDARNEMKKVKGWLTRDHGNGPKQVAVYHLLNADEINDAWTVKEIRKGEGRQLFLPFYPGKEVAGLVEELVKQGHNNVKAKLATKGTGQLIVTTDSKDTALLDEIRKQTTELLNNRDVSVMRYMRRFHVPLQATMHAKSLGLEKPAKNKKSDNTEQLDEKAKKRAEKTAKNLKAAMPENYNPKHRYRTVVSTKADLTEDIFQELKGDMAMERVLKEGLQATLQRGDIDTTKYEELESDLVKGTAEVLMSRGAGRYQIRRAPYLIEGFTRDNPLQLFESYMTGTAGMLSKANYALKQYQHLQTVPEKFKNWATGYVFDNLRNQGRLDQLSGDARTISAFYFLAGRVSSALVNSTQPYIKGVEEMGKQLGMSLSKAIRLTILAQKDIFFNRLTAEERQLFDTALFKAQRMQTRANEIGGTMGVGATGLLRKGFSALTSKLMALFQGVEMINRQTVILAAYRAARDKSLPSGMVDVNAFEKAVEINSKSNFDMGRHNLPGWARNPGGRAAYSLKSFLFFIANAVFNRLVSGKKEDQIALLRLIGMVWLFGGLSAMPGGDELDRIYRRLRGRSLKLDFQNWTAKNLGQFGSIGEAMYYFVWYGLPSLGGHGVTLHNSLRLETPFISDFLYDENLAETLLGAPLAVTVKTWRGAELLAKGNPYRAAETAAPEWAAGWMRSGRMYNTGATTASGKTIFDETGKPAKFTAAQAMLRGMGFLPVKIARQNELTSQMYQLRDYWQKEKQDRRDRYRNAKPGKQREKALQGIRDFNEELAKSQAAGLVSPATSDSVRSAVTYKPDMKALLWKQQYNSK